MRAKPFGVSSHVGIAVEADAGDVIVGQPAQAGEVFVAAIVVGCRRMAPCARADPQSRTGESGADAR